MHAHSVLLLDEYGQPLSTRLQSVLLPLARAASADNFQHSTTTAPSPKCWRNPVDALPLAKNERDRSTTCMPTPGSSCGAWPRCDFDMISGRSRAQP